MYRKTLKFHKTGFSMVEVALAILVLGIGLLTVVGLMSGGAEQSKGATAATQVACFANDVMESVRWQASLCGTNAANDFYDELKGRLDSGVDAVAKVLWDDDTQNKVKIKLQSDFTRIAYSVSSNVSFACRYRLGLTRNPYSDGITRSADVQLDVVSGLSYTQSFCTTVYCFNFDPNVK